MTKAGEKVNHGESVSTTAKNTESGPGKGEVVSQQARTQVRSQNFIDEDGDGVCDNQGKKVGKKNQAKSGKGYGPGDGTGNKGIGPKDGSGFGAGKSAGTGSGNNDGTGAKGNRGGRK